jgi:3,4-dihydroxy 2-butanone 4-phosphate synthase/GTP cyclohydrolase II
MEGETPIAVRVHVECFLSDVFGDKSCGCGARLHRAIQIISEKKRGVLIYLKKNSQELKKDADFTCVSAKRGIDKVNDTYVPDFREIGVGAQILRHLGIKNLDLLSSNPQKFVGLDGYGIQIHQRIPLLHVAGETVQTQKKTVENI